MNTWRTEFGNLFADRKILVTGAEGFIGGHLCRALITLGAEVYGLDRLDSSKINSSSYHPLAIDLTDFESVRNILTKIHPDLIYHLASMVTAQQDIGLILPMIQNTFLPAVHILLGSNELGCQRLVIMGSSEEPTNEVPRSPYGAAKAAASMYALMFSRIYELPVVIAKLFVVYGPGQAASKLIPYTVLSLLHGEIPHIRSADRICDFVYVLDVVRGLLKAGFQPGVEGKIIELGTGKGTSVRSVVQLLLELFHSSAQPKFNICSGIGEFSQVANFDVTHQLLNWKPLWSLEEGLLDTIARYRSSAEFK